MNCSISIAAVMLLQSFLGAAEHNLTEEAPFMVATRNAHEKEWVRTNEVGEVVARYTEVGTGICHLDPATGEWIDSNPEIHIRQGVAGGVADTGRHRLKVSPNVNGPDATVEITMPDGSTLKLQPMGLALTALDGSDSVFISELNASQGEKIDATTVIYRNAFSPVKADLRVRNSLAGVESDVIVRERINPADWGFAANSCKLEVWTEVIQAPASTVTVERIHGRRAGDADEDQNISFPSMSFAKGDAFQIASPLEVAQRASRVRVAKELFRDENRTYLIEAVPFQEAAPGIEVLPVNEARIGKKSNTVRMIASGGEKKPRSKPVSLAQAQARTERFMALLDKPDVDSSPGYIIDYTISQNQLGYTFRGDTTYLISAPVSLYGAGGNITKAIFEGGSVIKIGSGASLTVNSYCEAQFLSSPYRPTIFTVADDHTVGDKLNANPQVNAGTYVGSWALKINNAIPADIRNVVVRYAALGIQFAGTTGGELRHAQFVNCQKAIDTAAKLAVRNVLITHSNLLSGTPSALTAIAASGGVATAIEAQHVTVSVPVGYPMTVFSPGGSETLTFRNSIIYGASPAANYTKFNTVDSWTASPFVAAGAGLHYLARTAAAARNAGAVSGIDPGLLAEIRTLTTEPPQLLTGPITVNTVLAPTAWRDSDNPDLGYHYDPVDYFFTSLGVNGATLTVTNGTSLAMYGNTGVSFSGGGRFISEGSPANLNHFVHYQMVQEQPSAGGWPALGTTRAFFSASGTSGANSQEISMRFCDLSPGGGSGPVSALTVENIFYCNNFAISHSTLRNVAFGTAYYGQLNSGSTFALTNNCWERSSVVFVNPLGASYNLYMYNNLAFKGNWSFNNNVATTTWWVWDNLFDTESLTKSDSPSTMSLGNNGFVTGVTAIGGTGNRTVSAADYRKGVFGSFYYGPQLEAALAGYGSRTASAAGLSHFTVNGGLKDSGQVDIGYHSVATKPRTWVDESIPNSSIAGEDLISGAWPWDATGSPPFYTSSKTHKSPGTVNGQGFHQHYYTGANPAFTIDPGATIFAYVYIDTAFPSSSTSGEIMLQFYDPVNTWTRAFWGADVIALYPNSYTIWRRGMGDLPPKGQWVRLEIHARYLNLEGVAVSGVAFTQTAGMVTWDYLGIQTRELLDQDSDGLPDYWEDKNGDGLTTGDWSSFSSADTDGDGLNDQWELSLGLNPFSAEGVPAQTPGPTLKTFSYDLLNRVTGVAGNATGTFSVDPEGNVQ